MFCFFALKLKKSAQRMESLPLEILAMVAVVDELAWSAMMAIPRFARATQNGWLKTLRDQTFSVSVKSYIRLLVIRTIEFNNDVVSEEEIFLERNGSNYFAAIHPMRKLWNYYFDNAALFCEHIFLERRGHKTTKRNKRREKGKTVLLRKCLRAVNVVLGYCDSYRLFWSKQPNSNWFLRIKKKQNKESTKIKFAVHEDSVVVKAGKKNGAEYVLFTARKNNIISYRVKL